MPIHAGLLLVPMTVLSFRNESAVRARYDTLGIAAADLLEIPSLTMAMTERRWNLSLTTSSTVGYVNAFDFGRHDYILSQGLGGTYSYSFRRVTITYTQTGQIGRTNLRLASLPGSPQGVTPGPIGPALPPSGVGTPSNIALIDQQIWFGATYASLNVSEQLSRNVTMGEFVRGSISGSFASSGTTYPVQYSSGGGLSLGVQITPRDSLSTQVYFDRTQTQVPAGVQAPTGFIGVGITEGWTHTFSPRVTGTLLAGSIVTLPERSTAGYSVQWFPTVSAGLTIAGTPISVAIGVVPVIDQFSGRVDPRATISVTYFKPIGPRVNYFAGVSGATSLSAPPGLAANSFAAGTGLGFLLTRDLTLNTTVGGSYQLIPTTAATINNNSGLFYGYMGLVYAPSGTRL